MRLIVAALALYIVSLAASVAGQLLLSSLTGAASVVAVGAVLMQLRRGLNSLKSAAGEVAKFLPADAYDAAIFLYVVSGVFLQAAGYFLASQISELSSQIPQLQPTIDVEKIAGLALLVLGFLLLAVVGFVAWVYLVEVFTRDLYILQVAKGFVVFRPHSATFYIVLGLITLGLLYFYWLYIVWRWMSQLEKLMKSPPS